MSVADRVRGVINPTKTLAEQAAVEAAELERHIERTKTERARRAATATDLQRQLDELATRRDLLRARRDPGLNDGLFTRGMDNAEQIDQEIAALDVRQGELTAELAAARDAINRADLMIPDFQRRQKVATAAVITAQRRENFAVFEDLLPALEAAYQRVAELQQRAYVVANREETLRSHPAVARIRTDYVTEPSLIPPLDYLGPDLRTQPARVRQFREQLGKL